MTDLVEELQELDDVKNFSYKIKNRAIFIEVEITKSEISCKKSVKFTTPKGVGREMDSNEPSLRL